MKRSMAISQKLMIKPCSSPIIRASEEKQRTRTLMRKGQSVTRFVEEPFMTKDRVPRQNQISNILFLGIKITRHKWTLSFLFTENTTDGERAVDGDF